MNKFSLLSCLLLFRITLNAQSTSGTVTDTVRHQPSVPAKTLKEVIVTALGYSTTIRHAPVPIIVVTHDNFLQQASSNVIDAIAKQPGITEITEEPGYLQAGDQRPGL